MIRDPGMSRRISDVIRLRVSLIWPEVVAIQACVLFAAVFRGLDYLIPPDGNLRTLSVVERLVSVEVWGALFLIGGLMGLFGLVVRRPPLIPFTSIAHVLLLAVYGGFAVGAFCDVIGRDPIEGWRTPMDWLLVFVVIHWGFADASIDAWRDDREARKKNAT
ncbi:membrane protein [Gordonia phage VanLee]|uniref:Membrane protein n=1 Tax=Gordonia phage VanLee TaxID=2845816 RepID=A0A8F2IFC5_9CAUD|nr:membrane protein [Gordonia phage VanLee]QWS68148.1 membrane protein [Gordonia phage VanLee]